MAMFRRTVFAASLICIAPALGQPAQDHDAHHPDAGAPPQVTQPAAPPARTTSPGVPGMMGGNMMSGNAGENTQGGNMMGPGQMGSRGMMPMMNMMIGARSEHIEGRLAFLKTELKVTDAQTAQWNAFTDATRSNANSMSEMGKAMMSRQGAPLTLPDRLALEDKAVTAHLTGLKKTEETLANLYKVLTEDQKKIADSIVLGPIGMPMGMM